MACSFATGFPKQRYSTLSKNCQPPLALQRQGHRCWPAVLQQAFPNRDTAHCQKTVSRHWPCKDKGIVAGLQFCNRLSQTEIQHFRQKPSVATCHNKKGAGRKYFAPHGLPFRIARLLLVVTHAQLTLKQTGPYVPWHGGGPEPCGRWK